MASRFRATTIPVMLAGLLLGGGAQVTHAATHYPPPYPRKDAVKVLENCRVVIWNVTWPKGQWSPVHEHYRDDIIVTLRGGTVETMTPKGKTKFMTDKAGHVTWFEKGVIHKEMGVSTPARHAIVIELKRPEADCHI